MSCPSYKQCIPKKIIKDWQVCMDGLRNNKSEWVPFFRGRVLGRLYHFHHLEKEGGLGRVPGGHKFAQHWDSSVSLRSCLRRRLSIQDRKYTLTCSISDPVFALGNMFLLVIKWCSSRSWCLTYTNAFNERYYLPTGILVVVYYSDKLEARWIICTKERATMPMGTPLKDPNIKTVRRCS